MDFGDDDTDLRAAAAPGTVTEAVDALLARLGPLSPARIEDLARFTERQAAADKDLGRAAAGLAFAAELRSRAGRVGLLH